MTSLLLKPLRWICLGLWLSACSSLFTPEKPQMMVPATFAATTSAALAGHEIDAAWWTLFKDPTLDQLQVQLLQGHLNLQLLAAKVRQAQASVTAAQSSLWPSLSLNAGAGRAQDKGGSAVNQLNVAAPLTWEWDVWGRVGAQTAAAQANLQASREDLALARLSAQATLVQTYFALRTAERQVQVLQQAELAYEKALTLTRYRYEAGVVLSLIHISEPTRH